MLHLSALLRKIAERWLMISSMFSLAVTVMLLASWNTYSDREGRPKQQRGGTIVFTGSEWDAQQGHDDHEMRLHTNLWRINSDGTDSRPLTHLESYGCNSNNAGWSSDGNHNAFNSNCISQDVPPNTNPGKIITWSNVWIMNEDGSNPMPLMKSDKPTMNLGSAWSPDSRKIAFMSGHPQGNKPYIESSDIWVVNAAGSGAVQLTNAGRSTHCMDGGRVWSPDGSKLAFTSNRALDGSITPNLNEP